MALLMEPLCGLCGGGGTRASRPSLRATSLGGWGPRAARAWRRPCPLPLLPVGPVTGALLPGAAQLEATIVMLHPLLPANNGAGGCT